MNARKKIEMALSEQGTAKVPVVVPYERILIRDHYKEFSLPWWYWQSPDVNELFAYRCQTIDAIGQDWFQIWTITSSAEREKLKIEEHCSEVFIVNLETGVRQRLNEPIIGGETLNPKLKLPENQTDIDLSLPVNEQFSAREVLTYGRGELALQVIERYGNHCMPVMVLSSPMWSCFDVWGFETLLMLSATCPELLSYACQRQRQLVEQQVDEAALLGAGCIWIEECSTDCISPAQYRDINLPVLKKLIEYIRSLGLKSIYYYCGNPNDRWEFLMQTGADAIALEESKKNFNIKIEDVIAKVQGRCAVLGNMDSIAVLQDASETDLQKEIERQLNESRKNNHRFIMSLGSPVTPSTRLMRVRQFCDIAHKCGV